MPYRNVYLDEEEMAFVKLHDEGFVRKCVREWLDCEIEAYETFDDYDGVFTKGVPTEIKLEKKPKESHKITDPIEKLKEIPGVEIASQVREFKAPMFKEKKRKK